MGNLRSREGLGAIFFAEYWPRTVAAAAALAGTAQENYYSLIVIVTSALLYAIGPLLYSSLNALRLLPAAAVLSCLHSSFVQYRP